MLNLVQCRTHPLSNKKPTLEQLSRFLFLYSTVGVPPPQSEIDKELKKVRSRSICGIDVNVDYVQYQTNPAWTSFRFYLLYRLSLIHI